MKTRFLVLAWLMAACELILAQNQPPREPGAVVGWGSMVLPYVPLETKYQAIAAGRAHTVALKADGSVIVWGANYYGQAAVPTAAPNGVIAIAAGYDHTVALKTNGSVVAWGSGTSNTGMDPHYGQSIVPTAALGGVVAIAAGGVHTVALKADGSVIAWGNNRYGQTTVPEEARKGVVAIAAGHYHTVALKADGSVIVWGVASVPEAAQEGVVAIAAGGEHTVALKTDGSVIAWGRNDSGQTTVPTAAKSSVVAIAAGEAHTVALKTDGSVIAWGNNRYGQTTVPAAARNGVMAITAGYDHTVALKADGSVIAWGYNDFGQTTTPAECSGVVAVAANFYHAAALKTDGSVIAWGSNNYGQTTVPAAARSDVVAIATGAHYTMALKANGFMLGWGLNSEGQTTVPAAVQGSVVAIAAGEAHTVALRTDGSVSVWGRKASGQTTVPESALSEVVAIAAGGEHTVALKSDGSVIAWGRNDFGQATVPVAARDSVVAIAAGRFHTVALKSNGSVIAWGDNRSGQATVPAAAQGGVVAITAGETHTVALKADGFVRAWGSQTTVPVTAQGRAFAVAAGESHTVALLAASGQGSGLRILRQPFHQTVRAGWQVSFSVTVSGTSPLSYQWRKNGVNLAGATSAMFTLNSVSATDSAGYSVVVRNATESIVSDTAHLAVLTDGSNEVLVTQIAKPELPITQPVLNNLVVITHGWQPLGDRPEWVKNMADTLRLKLESEGETDWHVVAYYWDEAITVLPSSAFDNGKVLGHLMGQRIAEKAWEHVHLIGHSAGSALIQAAADTIHRSAPDIQIHTTFLDPFLRWDLEGQGWFGRNADWSDNYFADDFFTQKYTGNWLTHSHNVNVTWLDKEHIFYVMKFCPASEMAPVPFLNEQVPCGVQAHVSSSHGWPYEFYQQTLSSDVANAAGYGFARSKEGGGWDNRSQYPVGKAPVVLNGQEALPRKVEHQQIGPVFYLGLLPIATSPGGVNSSGNAGFNLNSGSPLPGSQGSSRPSGIHLMQGNATVSAWLAVGVTITNAVNFVQFDAGFAGTGAAEGLLTVYWNTNRVGMVDERVASPGLQAYRFALPSTETNGLFTLSFRLDAFHQTASSVTVTNVAMGFVGVTQPITLEAAGLATNGAPVLKLTGAPDYTYLIQSSANLLDWTPTALLVNTNGTVLFAEPGPASPTARFYRATLP